MIPGRGFSPRVRNTLRVLVVLAYVAIVWVIHWILTTPSAIGGWLLYGVAIATLVTVIYRECKRADDAEQELERLRAQHRRPNPY